jgi:hypothetical protein
LFHLTHLFNLCVQLSHIPNSWKEAKLLTLPKPGKEPKFAQNFCPTSLLSTTGKLSEKVILQLLQKHIEERRLLNANQFGLRARHNTILQCMCLTDHVTLNFNNKIFTAAVFLDIEKASDITWHKDLLCKISKLEFSNSLKKNLLQTFFPNVNSEIRLMV